MHIDVMLTNTGHSSQCCKQQQKNFWENLIPFMPTWESKCFLRCFILIGRRTHNQRIEQLWKDVLFLPQKSRLLTIFEGENYLVVANQYVVFLIAQFLIAFHEPEYNIYNT